MTFSLSLGIIEPLFFTANGGSSSKRALDAGLVARAAARTIDLEEEAAMGARKGKQVVKSTANVPEWARVRDLDGMVGEGRVGSGEGDVSAARWRR